LEPDELNLRLLLDAYLQGGVDGIGTCEEIIKKIERFLEKDKAEYDQKGILGRQMLAHYYRPNLIKKVHRSHDDSLIDLFTKYLPLPPGSIFNDGTLPEHIALVETEKEELVHQFLLAAKDEDKALKHVRRIQREIRGWMREKEQVANVKALLMDLKFSPEDADKAINNIHYPYFPKCSKALGRKIVAAATQVHLWPTVRHLTSTKYLNSIFDDGLMGRRNLRNLYKCFSPAALYPDDIRNGDGNIDQLPYEKRLSIYRKFHQMNEQELLKTLTEFGKKAIDTAEFNFYGCYLPSLEHVLDINFWQYANRPMERKTFRAL
jgi:hypothetical protein